MTCEVTIERSNFLRCNARSGEGGAILYSCSNSPDNEALDISHSTFEVCEAIQEQ